MALRVMRGQSFDANAAALRSALANPAGAIASAAMMLNHLGLGDSGTILTEALEATLAAGCRTSDLGGDASCSEFGAAVRDRLLVRNRRDEGLRHLFMTNRGLCG